MSKVEDIIKGDGEDTLKQGHITNIKGKLQELLENPTANKLAEVKGSLNN